MSVAMRVSAVAILGVGLLSCGGGKSDQSAIRGVFQDFFNAFENQDVEKLASLLSDNCDNRGDIATGAIQSYVQSTGGAAIEYDVTGVDFKDLTETTAEARPEGYSLAEGAEFPLGDASSAYANLEKVDGKWKFADCNILF